MKCFLSLILIINILCLPVFAMELDTSIDDDIRKNYNPSKLEEDVELPALPNITNVQNRQNIQATKSVKPIVEQSYQQTNIAEAYYAIIKKGKKVKVRSLNNVTDSFKKGTRVTFVSKYPLSATCFTIPAGTIFKGEIVKSHKPQFLGNGGLIAIRVDSIILDNNIQPINAFVTKADSKKIFFNNIKGKRKYISSMFNSTKPGCHFFGKMLRITANLATDGSSIFVAPFSFLIGSVAFAGNIAVSPVLAVFHKGNSIQIPAGSSFELKFNQDVFIYN